MQHATIPIPRGTSVNKMANCRSAAGSSSSAWTLIAGQRASQEFEAPACAPQRCRSCFGRRLPLHVQTRHPLGHLQGRKAWSGTGHGDGQGEA